MSRGFLPLLALMIYASYGVAITAGTGDSIEALCKNTIDDKYCVDLLKPLLTPSTNFSSLKWNRAVLSKAMTKARTAREFMTTQADSPNLDFKQHSTLKDCLDNLDRSVENLHQAAREYVEAYSYYGTQDFDLHKSYVQSLMETAALDQGNCYSSLGLCNVNTMIPILQKAEHAYKANKIAEKIVLLN